MKSEGVNASDTNEYLFDPEAFAAGESFAERRRMPRARYEVAATLATAGPDGHEFVLHTRDVNSGGSGFVTADDLRDVEAATIRMPGPDGGVRHVKCHVRRARAIGEGWVEGYVEFDEPTTVFSTKRINAAHAARRQPVLAGA